jgi:hypothetical protein
MRAMGNPILTPAMEDPPKFPCRQCNGIIDTDEEACYTITYDPAREDKREKKAKVRTTFFHVGCFQEIAGKKYM